MIAYLNGLSSLDRVFFLCAFAGGLLFLARAVLTIFMGDHGGHLHADGAGGFHDGGGDFHDGSATHDDGLSHSDAGMRLLTMQGLTSFFLIFGLIGLGLHRGGGVGDFTSILYAVAAGFLTMLMVGKIFEMMSRLQSSGNINIHRSLGQVGTIYLTIPEGGVGQVELCLQNRLRVIDAVSQDSQPIKTGERVEVVDILEGSKLIVRKAVKAPAVAN